MLFHESIFIFLFLPMVLSIYLFCKINNFIKSSIILLSFFSIFFYGYWEIKYIPLLIISIIFNFIVGNYLIQNLKKSNLILYLAILTNLLFLMFYKYSPMIIDNFNFLLIEKISVDYPELPLGISFFTFLQIAYIVDCAKGKVHNTSFSSYFLFVSFFPHLIAGPLVHHKDLIPQFSKKVTNVLENLSVGTIIFGIGLFKKLVLSEQVSGWSDDMFNSVENGIMPSMISAWIGVLSFTLLIYFDFSAYSDMAIGLSKMMGIRLPENFNSPYKSINIIDFWRRWHITLSYFLKNYLYFPLGGNRRGLNRKYQNILIVMIIAGLWHGADWTFVLWGAIHGFLLLINHFWQKIKLFKINKIFSLWLTFFAVLLAWVPFRSATMETTFNIYKGMFGGFGLLLPKHYQIFISDNLNEILLNLGVQFSSVHGFGGKSQIFILLLLLLFVMKLPNTQQIFEDYKPTLGSSAKKINGLFKWKPRFIETILLGLMSSYLLLLVIQGKSGEFIYFQF